VQLPRREPDDANTQPSMHKRVVQVFPLEYRHPAIFARLPVENEVDAQQRGAEDSGAVEKALLQVALGYGVYGDGRLLVGTAECGAEDLLGFGEGGGGLGGEEGFGLLFEWGAIVECTEGGGLGRFCGLAEGCRDGEGSP
jgi:hypothetical protein